MGGSGMVSPALARGAVLLADWGNKDLTGGRGEEFGKAAPMGLALILALLLGVFLLVRSMNKHLRKLPKSFDDESGPGGAESAGPGDSGPEGPLDSGGGPAGPERSGGPEGDGGGGGPKEPGDRRPHLA